MKTVCLFLLFIAAFRSYGQYFSPLQISCKTNGSQSEISNNLKAQLTIPLCISEKNTLVISPMCKSIRCGDSLVDGENDFYELAIRLAWQNKLSERVGCTFLMVPSLASPYSDISPDALSGKAAVRFHLKQSDRITYKFGLVYSLQFHTHTLVPFLGIKWKPSEQVTLSGNLPFRAELQWVPLSKLSTGLIYHGERFAAPVPATPDNRYFKLREKNLGWEGSLNIFRGCWFTTEVGWCFKRSFTIYSEPETYKWSFPTEFMHSGNASIFNHNENGIYAKFGISYRFNNNVLE